MLARCGERWLLKEGAGDWQRCQQPAGPWAFAWLPDPVFLARTLADILPRSKWETTAESLDERMMRVHRLELDNDAVSTLLSRGALPEVADVASGLGTLSRVYIGRQVRRPERRLVVRIYEDAKAKLPARFVVEIFQQGGANVMGGAQVVGGAPVPPPPVPVEPKDGKQQEELPTMRAELVLRNVGETKLDVIDDKARVLLGGDK